MPVYTSGRVYTRNYTGSRIRHLSGYVRPGDTKFDMLDVSGILVMSGETPETLNGVISFPTAAPTAIPFYTSVSANASKGGRINFSYTKMYAEAAATMPTGTEGATSIAEFCDDGEWSGNINISYEGPACDDVRITGATGSITTTANGDSTVLATVTNAFETMIGTASWLSTDEAESGTEYDPVEGARAFVRKDIFDSDDEDLPTAWFSLTV
jgi:hypothetical protein